MQIHSLTRPFVIFSSVLLFLSCAKTGSNPPGAGNPPSSADTTISHPTADNAGKFAGYYKVTENASGIGDYFANVSFIFTGQIAKVNDNTLGIVQTVNRTPVTYWTLDFYLHIHPDLKDSLDNPPLTPTGRILDDSTIRIHYLLGTPAGLFTVDQVWQKIDNLADTSLYQFKDTVKNKIITIAGSSFRYGPLEAAPKDDGPAIAADISGPRYIITDMDGNIYVSDIGHHTIRKISRSGTITRVAGNNTKGYSGDGGSPFDAQLNEPAGIALDKAGNLFIADLGNHVIRMVNRTTGLISTFAGTGVKGFSGDNGPAVQAQLYSPNGLTFDGNGNLLVADQDAQVVRKISPGGIITTIAGTGEVGYSGDNGPATQAKLSIPTDVRVDAQGNIYIADSWNNLVRKVDASGIITVFAGRYPTSGYEGNGGPAAQAQLSRPNNLAIGSDGSIFISDFGNLLIRKVTPDGIISNCAGFGVETWEGYGIYSYCGDYGPALKAYLSPLGIELDQQGNLLVADIVNQRVRKIFFP